MGIVQDRQYPADDERRSGRAARGGSGTLDLTPDMKREIARSVIELLARHGLIDRNAPGRIGNSED